MTDFYQDFSGSQHLTYVAHQHPQTWGTFESFLRDEGFDLILEIGTGPGGLTEYMKDLGHQVISYDINDNRYGTHTDLIAKGVDIRHKDVFDSEYTILDQEVITLLQTGRALVLCDGGNNAKEFNLIAQHIKQGDVIMGHDYCTDCETFDVNYKDKEWRWLELVDEDIQDQCLSLGLESYKQDLFTPIFWVCKTLPIS